MKKAPMIVMLTAPYVLFGLYMSGNTEVWPEALIAFAAVMLFGALYAFFLLRMGCNGKQILFWCMLLKVCYIPIFLLIYLVSLGLFAVMIPIILILVVFDCLLLLSTSTYGICGLLRCGKENRLPAKTVALNIILQFFFCADVLSAIYCYRKSRPQGRASVPARLAKACGATGRDRARPLQNIREHDAGLGD